MARVETLKRQFFKCLGLLAGCTSFALWASQPQVVEKADKTELEWGNVLFEYYQKDYFEALIEYEYAKTINNDTAKSDYGQMLQGGMLLSYGQAKQSQEIFDRVLARSADPLVRNRAWYYLANLYYHKSEPEKAHQSLAKISGPVPSDLFPEFYHLTSLINSDVENLAQAENILSQVPEDSKHYPYVLFNVAIGQLRSNELKKSLINLTKVNQYAARSEEHASLSDRATHGLAQLALKSGNLPTAWANLQKIRTNGLYSNRGLLTYAWTAIKIKQFNEAIPALEILQSRDIAIPEVQEAKVLLAHLYEQQGAPRKALKSNLISIDEFAKGINRVAEARDIIAKQNVPEEFVRNLDVIIDDSDWFGAQPSIDYQKLTPFLIDLMSSRILNETLKELSDLYAIKKNLENWEFQSNEHLLIMNNADKKSISKEERKAIQRSKAIQQQLSDKKQELKLLMLSLKPEEQKRFQSTIDSIDKEIAILQSRTDGMSRLSQPYKQPASVKKEMKDKHNQVKQKLKQTSRLIAKLEPVVRSLVNEELDKHEERMRYYWAQSRLAKARLYDTTLMELDNVTSNKESGEGVK
ncbi:MAG: hypothetical protein HWE27_07460 [Gammaproteobacteria bacterium]|nr:hypothetical protein [Gammaproteobacteria bacterium]